MANRTVHRNFVEAMELILMTAKNTYEKHGKTWNEDVKCGIYCATRVKLYAIKQSEFTWKWWKEAEHILFKHRYEYIENEKIFTIKPMSAEDGYKLLQETPKHTKETKTKKPVDNKPQKTGTNLFTLCANIKTATNAESKPKGKVIMNKCVRTTNKTRQRLARNIERLKRFRMQSQTNQRNPQPKEIDMNKYIKTETYYDTSDLMSGFSGGSCKGELKGYEVKSIDIMKFEPTGTWPTDSSAQDTMKQVDRKLEQRGIDLETRLKTIIEMNERFKKSLAGLEGYGNMGKVLEICKAEQETVLA